MSFGQRRTPLRRVSPKRQAQQAERRAVVAQVRRRARDRCEGWRFIPEHGSAGSTGSRCYGTLDPHELIPRSQWTGGVLDPDNVVLICRALHDWTHDHPAEAREAGLLR